MIRKFEFVAKNQFLTIFISIKFKIDWISLIKMNTFPKKVQSNLNSRDVGTIQNEILSNRRFSIDLPFYWLKI